MQETHRFIVYFDHSCPMCRQEIAFYQRRSGADQIDWVDVSQPENAPREVSCTDAMARFHVRASSGTLIDGGAAFAELWKVLPAFKWAGHVFSAPPGRWLINLVYDLFLPFRPRLQQLFQSRP
jgi:predicted DCC family thiol-disulfide oxidoreductase YuxK